MSKSENDKKKTDVSEGTVKRSIKLMMIRHAESGNNQVYRNARYIYRGGTPDFDEDGWRNYVDTHRSADPDLSDTGNQQAEHLAGYLVPHLSNQASHPVRILTSPMKRTLQTIRPTLEQLNQEESSATNNPKCQVKVVGFYHESEGCHNKEEPEEGMNPKEISELLKDSVASTDDNIDFVGFPKPDRGWYVHGKSSETRAESEARAAKFYLWLCEYLDEELSTPEEDVFDAGVAIPGEEHENEHDKHGQRIRRRRTAVLVGHGDFMSLVLKRIVAGFGHSVENEGIPHRSAFVHYNTGITSLEYFGKGRFLVMATNETPHIHPNEYATLRTGGSLKDGWSYLMPDDQFVLYSEVSVAFEDELDEHIREQKEALKALYLSSETQLNLTTQSDLTVEEDAPGSENRTDSGDLHFIVQRGMQVVGVTSVNAAGELYDFAVRPSAKREVAEALLKAVKDHQRKVKRSSSIIVRPRSTECIEMFEQMGFQEKQNADTLELELDH